MKQVLILCGGHPFCCDDGFGYHVSKALEKMDLPDNIECVECGYSASECSHIIDGKDKMIFVDILRTEDEPGTILRLEPEKVPITVNGVTDVPKLHLMELLDEIKICGKCPETVFICVVPKEADTVSEHLTPEVEAKLPEVIAFIMEEIKDAL